MCVRPMFVDVVVVDFGEYLPWRPQFWGSHCYDSQLNGGKVRKYFFFKEKMM